MKLHLTQAELQVILSKHINDHMHGDEMPPIGVTSIELSHGANNGVIHLILTLTPVTEDAE